MSKFDTFVSIMERTSSSNDHEALTAIKKANKIMGEMEMSWGELLHAKKAIADELLVSDGEIGEEPTFNDVKADEIGMKLDFLVKNVSSGSFRNFVESVQIQYKRRGSLTPRQLKAVSDAYDRQTSSRATTTPF